MINQKNIPNDNCDMAEPLLPQFVAGDLSARQTWQLEKHLTSCSDCSLKVEQLRLTIGLLQNCTKLDTSDDFMAKLHARIDAVDASSQDFKASEQRTSFRDIFRRIASVRRVPGLPIGVALGVAAVLMISLIPGIRPSQSATSAYQPDAHISTVVEAQLAQTAADPLGDAAADQLVVHQDSSTIDNTNP
jgi:anti-sigma factor RsiW